MVFVIFTILFIAPIVITSIIPKHQSHNGPQCGPTILSASEGTISSPNYPHLYPNYTSCTWVIMSPPKTVLSLSLLDFDIEEDANCDHPPCCLHTWLSLPKEGGRGTQQLCGRKINFSPISLSQGTTNIKFHSSKVIKGGRGFHLRYSTRLEPDLKDFLCPADEIHCDDGRCVMADQAMLCDMPQLCGLGMVPCEAGVLNSECFDNATQRCNGIKDCLSGIDEINCGSHNCFPDEVMCQSGEGCYKVHQKCDSKPDCSDFSDEIDCGFCGYGQVLCGSVDGRCFYPRLERCNGNFDCPLGEDEVGCSKACPEDEIACTNGKHCYSPHQRCDSRRNCGDGSDETNCPPCTSMVNKFQCDNGRCIPDQLCCNNFDNCGDGSDEHNCLKNSMITAAIMGSLICGLLLIIAIGCMCRVYGLRVTATRHNYQVHQNQLHRATRQTILHPDEEFFYRDPPPSYSVATADSQQLQRLSTQENATRVFAMAAASDNGSTQSRHPNRPRSSRRHLNSSNSSRRRSQRYLARNTSPSRSQPPVVPTAPTPPDVHETTLEAHQQSLIVASDDKSTSTTWPPDSGRQNNEDGMSTTSSSTDSPSRDSVTSSTSLLSNLSNNDDTQLLIA